MTSDIEFGEYGPVTTAPGRMDDLLDQIGLTDDITHVTAIASDGYRASIPLATLSEGGVLSVEDDAWRLRVIDGATLCWNVKDVVRLEPTRGPAEDDIPANPTH